MISTNCLSNSWKAQNYLFHANVVAISIILTTKDREIICIHYGWRTTDSMRATSTSDIKDHILIKHHKTKEEIKLKERGSTLAIYCFNMEINNPSLMHRSGLDESSTSGCRWSYTFIAKAPTFSG